MHREALILDRAIAETDVWTVAELDPALTALNPEPRRFDDEELTRINAEAIELADREAGSLRAIMRWLTSIEPPRAPGEH